MIAPRQTKPFAILLKPPLLPVCGASALSLSTMPGTLGMDPILPTTWFSQDTVDGMAAEFAAGSWDVDALLTAVIGSLDDFYWQSHSLCHLARDNLAESDCDAEDGGEIFCTFRVLELSLLWCLAQSVLLVP